MNSASPCETCCCGHIDELQAHVGSGFFYAQMLCFAGYAGFMFLFTLYLEVYLGLPLDKTAVSYPPWLTMCWQMS